MITVICGSRFIDFFLKKELNFLRINFFQNTLSKDNSQILHY